MTTAVLLLYTLLLLLLLDEGGKPRRMRKRESAKQLEKLEGCTCMPRTSCFASNLNPAEKRRLHALPMVPRKARAVCGMLLCVCHHAAEEPRLKTGAAVPWDPWFTG